MATLIQSPEPIRTIYLHVRSKDALQQTTGYNTDFCIDLLQAVQADADEVIDITLISASIPHSFYGISAHLGNDTIVYDTNQTLTLLTQNYDPWELVRVINADAAFNAIFTASYNIYNNKMIFTNTTGISHDLNWTSSGAANPLGYQLAADETITAGSSSSSPDMVDLATIHSIIIRSDMAQGNVQTTNSGGLSMLQTINVNVDPFSMIYLDATDVPTVSLSHAPAIDRVCFRFEDQNGKLLQMNNRNFEFTVRFHVHLLVPRHNPTATTIINQVAATPAATSAPLVRNPLQTIGQALAGTNAFLPPTVAQPPPAATRRVSIEHAINETILDSLI